MKKISSAAAIVAFGGSLFGLAAAPIAEAGTGGGTGTGGCVSGCHVTAGNVFWRFADSSGGQSAWTKLMGTQTSYGLSGYRYNTSMGFFNNNISAFGETKSEFENDCRNSKIIWWISYRGSLNGSRPNPQIYNYQGATYPSIGNGKANSTFLTAASGSGSMDTGTQARMANWANSHVSSSNNNVAMLCSAVAGDNIKPSPIVTQWNESKQSSNTTSQNWTLPYSYSTTIRRQITKNGIDPIGANNLHDQPATSTKTNFGVLWDDITTNPNKYKTMSTSALNTLVNTAKAKDARANHNLVNLDAQNKTGFAEGGVLNVNELTKNATITAKQTSVTNSTRSCTQTTDWAQDSNGNWVKQTPVTSCGSWVDTAGTPSYAQSTSIDSTLKQTAFWQMLSVHCNQTAFNSLVSASGATVVSTGDPTKNLSAVAYSKTYTSQPNVLDFGDSNNTNTALKVSGDVGFYDKVCSFSCTTGNANGSSASAANGATSNIGSKTPAGGSKTGLYGAVSGGINGNSFSFFRDNQQHRLNVDVWYPISSGVVSYAGAAPVSTIVTRWAEGTPSLDGSSGGTFKMATADGQQLFAGNDSAATFKDWSTTPYSNSTTTVLSGLARSFDVQATWSSETNKPQIFNFKWVYAPNVATSFATNQIGFNSTDQRMGTATTQSAPIYGACAASFGSTTNKDLTQQMFPNSGTGTIDGLNDNLLDGSDASGNTNLFVKFIRSTTE